MLYMPACLTSLLAMFLLSYPVASASSPPHTCCIPYINARCSQLIQYIICIIIRLFAFVVGGLGFEFCVFVAGWRHALRSEWPFIIIIIIRLLTWLLTGLILIILMTIYSLGRTRIYIWRGESAGAELPVVWSLSFRLQLGT